MLRLVGVLLSCGALCLMSPVPPNAGTGCNVSSLIQETLSNVRTLISEGSSKITPPNNMLEEGRNVTTYLRTFIEVLSKEKSEEKRIARSLENIQDALKSCHGWMERDWQPSEDKDFFSNLEYFLRFLNHHAV